MGSQALLSATRTDPTSRPSAPGGPVGGPSVESQIARDIAKRAIVVGPLIVAIAGLARGWPGAASAAIAVALVLVNLIAGAALLAWAARISLTAIMVAALGGFLGRMIVVVAVLVGLCHQSWIDLPALAVTVLVTQLGLLLWETRYVSASLAYPALKPGAPQQTHKGA